SASCARSRSLNGSNACETARRSSSDLGGTPTAASEPLRLRRNSFNAAVFMDTFLSDLPERVLGCLAFLHETTVFISNVFNGNSGELDLALARKITLVLGIVP